MRPSRVVTRAMNVLVVAPDGERREVVRTLTSLGAPGEIVITEADSAARAMEIFRRDHSDLILVTTASLDTTGQEIARLVREEEGHRHTGLIFIDQRPLGDETLSVTCLEMGADDFLRHGASASELMARVRAVLRLKAMTDELRTANHQLRILSMTDELTGLANMRSFNQTFGDAVRRCRRGDTALAVLMMDLDHFKTVNDTANHLVGSHVLREIGRLLREKDLLGPRDVAARYGGDEFIVLCETDDLDQAGACAERIRDAIARRLFERDGCEIRITSSIGVAWVKAGFAGRAEDIVKAADLMLYRSKDQGRDRVSGMVLSYPTNLSSSAAGRDLKVAPAETGEPIDLARVLRRR